MIDIDEKLLLEAKEKALEDLKEYAEYEEETTTTRMNNLVDEEINKISAATSLSEVDSKLKIAKNNVDYENDLETAKQIALDGLKDYTNYDNASDVMKGLVDNFNFNNVDTFEELATSVRDKEDEIDNQKLAELKEDAVSAINDKYDDLLLSNVYDDEAKALLLSIKDMAISTINDPNTTNHYFIETTKNQAIIDLDNVPTYVDLALAQLLEEFESYNENDYNEENWKDLVKAYEEAKELIEITDEIDNIDAELQLGIDNMKDILSITQIEAILLAEAKEDALAELLEEYQKYDENDYSDNNWQDLVDAYNDGINKIENSTSISDVNHELEEAKNNMEAILVYEDELAETKDRALEDLKDAYESYKENDYSEDNWEDLVHAYNDAKDAINESSLIEDVNTNLLEGINNMSDVETLADLSEAKQSAKDELDDFLNNVNNPSKELEDIIELGKDKIDEQTSISDVNDKLEDALKDAKAQKKKDDLLDELNNLYNKDYFDNDNYSEDGITELEDIYNEIINKIDNGDYETTEELLNDASNRLDEVDVIKSGDYDITDPEIEYEDNPEDGYYATVTNESGMKKGYKVLVIPEVKVNTDYEIEILNHIKMGNIELTNDDLSLNDVKDKSLFAHLKITLVDQDNNELKGDEIPKGTYIVSFLLPNEFRGRENIRVVYLGVDKVEVFKTEVNENYWLTFETDHFSDFFLIADPLPNELPNLWWVIILELVIIAGLLTGIIYKKKDNHEKRLNMTLFPILAAFVPKNAILIITLLGVIIILLTLYLIYLFIGLDWLLKEKEAKEEVIVIKEKVVETKALEKEVEKSVVKETVKPVVKEKVFIPKTIDDLEKAPKVLFNYSFTARLHLADPKTVERFNEIKNYILSYEGIKVSKTWGQETYLYKNESVFKVRVSGKTMNLFFNLIPKDFEGTKYTLEDRSDVKTHHKTPAQFQVNGPRKLVWAKELIDIYMKEAGGVKLDNYKKEDYRVKPIDKNELIKMKLIKVSGLNKEYEEIIFKK